MGLMSREIKDLGKAADGADYGLRSTLPYGLDGVWSIVPAQMGAEHFYRCCALSHSVILLAPLCYSIRLRPGAEK